MFIVMHEFVRDSTTLLRQLGESEVLFALFSPPGSQWSSKNQYSVSMRSQRRESPPCGSKSSISHRRIQWEQELYINSSQNPNPVITTTENYRGPHGPKGSVAFT